MRPSPPPLPLLHDCEHRTRLRVLRDVYHEGCTWSVIVELGSRFHATRVMEQPGTCSGDIPKPACVLPHFSPTNLSQPSSPDYPPLCRFPVFPLPVHHPKRMKIKVKALNRWTAEEPSGRWGLLRDVMEDKDTTKVLLRATSMFIEVIYISFSSAVRFHSEPFCFRSAGIFYVRFSRLFIITLVWHHAVGTLRVEFNICITQPMVALFRVFEPLPPDYFPGSAQGFLRTYTLPDVSTTTCGMLIFRSV